MNKAMKELLQLLAHAKAAGYHLRRSEQLAKDRWQHDLAAKFQIAHMHLQDATAEAQRIYGAAAMGDVPRAR